MPVAMPVVWDDHCLLHEPGGEVWIGVRTRGTEVSQRIENIRGELADACIVPAEGH
jgi:hypothetical protein